MYIRIYVADRLFVLDESLAMSVILQPILLLQRSLLDAPSDYKRNDQIFMRALIGFVEKFSILLFSCSKSLRIARL